MKDYILNKLLDSRGTYVSGSDLCRPLNVTRSAVWKEILTLRAQGFGIEAAPRKGYCLVTLPETLNEGLLKYMLRGSMWKKILLYESVTSTNTVLKTLPGLTEGIALFALSQTDGRGRRGKSWHSPDEGNVYLSVSFCPNLPISQIPLMSLCAGLAVARTIEEECTLPCAIKWPNDVVAGGKKLCGILSEITGEVEGGCMCVVGIGINVKNTLFPDTVQTPATSLAAEKITDVDIHSLAAKLLENLEYEYRHMDTLIENYKKQCITLGKQVGIHRNGEVETAYAQDIAPDGSLIVEKDGRQEIVNSGEVSVRGMDGYV